MDCLEIFQMPGSNTDDELFGVYHMLMEPSNVFKIMLAKTTMNSLGSWEFITDLDNHASQPSVHVNEDGSLLIAHERTETPHGNLIRLRYYKSFSDLMINKFHSQVDLDRQLARDAEGTPSFESVKIIDHDLDNSEIVMRFHYYKNNDVD